MKKLIFSKKYLKTKLGIFTWIITILYHFICKETDYNMEVDRPKEFLNEKCFKEPNLIKFYEEDDQQFAKMSTESQEIDNLEVISSKWILDYLKKIQNRRRALKMPKLPPKFRSTDFRELEIDEFLNSQIIEDLIKLINSEKYFSKNKGLKKATIVSDLIAFGGEKRFGKFSFTLNAIFTGLMGYFR